jgi:hypothetical protein
MQAFQFALSSAASEGSQAAPSLRGHYVRDGGMITTAREQTLRTEYIEVSQPSLL